MTHIQRHHTNDRMSQIVVHGNTVYIAGQVAWKNKGGSIADQTAEILNAIESYLLEAGSSKEHMLSASVWLSNVALQFDEFNQVWDKWVPKGHAPARACVEAVLAGPDFYVEVAVIAAKK